MRRRTKWSVMFRYQLASALALSAVNSSSLIVPASSRDFADAI
jgi:hypothetical protein